MATASDLQQLYVGYFGRAADQTGLNFWVEAINKGGLSLANVHTSFVQSAEYTAKYTGLTSAALVAQVYLNVLGRPVDAAGQTFWANAIDTGVITQAQLIQGVLSGLSAGDQAIINNKVTVANYYTAQRGAEFNTADIATSATILTPVNGSTASVSTALNTIATTVPGQAASSAAVTSALNTYLAAAKAEEDFAKTVIDPVTKKAVVDGNANGSVLDEATNVATTASTTAFGAAATAATNATTGAVVTLDAADSAAVTAAKLADATAKAAAAVTVAQGKVDAVAGLNAAVKAFDAALVTHTAANTAASAAALEQTAELAKFNAINGAVVTIGPLGVVAGVTIVDVATGNLVIDPAYATANAAAPAKLAAANDLLVDIKANLVAAKALADANTAVDAAGAKVANLDTTVAAAGEYDAATNKFTSGLALALSNEKDEQAALTKAITDLNAANALSKQLADLATATTNADKAIDTVLAGGLVEVVAATAGTPDSAELFVFNAAKFVGPAVAGLALQKGDFLSIGTGYTKATDVDAVKAGMQGSDSVLEVFFKTNGANTEVTVEKTAFGTSAVVPEIVTITLTGVTADKLAFDAGTGLISVA